MTNIIQLKNHTLRDTIINKKMELFEVKQMAEMEHEFKMQCQVALKAYKNWQNQHKNETDGVEIYYGQLRGIVLKRQAQDAVQAYWIVRQDFRLVFHRYLQAHLPYRPRGIKQKTA